PSANQTRALRPSTHVLFMISRVQRLFQHSSSRACDGAADRAARKETRQDWLRSGKTIPQGVADETACGAGDAEPTGGIAGLVAGDAGLGVALIEWSVLDGAGAGNTGPGGAAAAGVVLLASGVVD